MNSLISIVIVTYNSSQFIIETLESVFNQTWEETELIITDDCSEDDTIEICRNWVKENKQRFVRTEILTSDKNTGVPANANRALYAAEGDWIIFLAGDDTLKPDCMSNNMSWIASNPEIKVLFSFVEVFKDTFEPQNLLKTVPGDPFNPKGIMAPGRSAESQYRMLLLSDRIHYTPSALLHRKTLISVGGFDERFKLLEDHPLWLRLTQNGYKLYFMDKVTVNYRRHLKAINNMNAERLINQNYFKHENFRRIYTYPNLPTDVAMGQRFNWYVSQVFRFDRMNRNRWVNRFLLSLLTIYLNPVKYFIWIKKRMNKKLSNVEFYN